MVDFCTIPSTAFQKPLTWSIASGCVGAQPFLLHKYNDLLVWIE